MKTIFLCPLAFLLLTALLAPATLRADPWSEPLKALRQVGPEGQGNAEAATAWNAIATQGPEVILPTLSAMENASLLARNWMRTAVEAVFAKELAAGGSALPGQEMKSFLLDRDNEPSARHLAFDLLSQVDPEGTSALVPGMIDDPSNPLRREAIARLLEEGRSQFRDGAHEASIATLSSALDAARDVDQIQAIAKLLRDDLKQDVDLPKHFGFLMYWHLIAPFDNTDRAGFDAVFPPEEEIDLDAAYEGKESEEVTWQKYATSDDFGMVDFNQPFSPLKQVVGYGYTEFTSAETREAELRLGCKNAWKIWLNGELLFGRDEYHRGIRIDQYVLPVTLREGKNTILVKACQNEQEQDWTVQWQFQLRVCDSAGTAILSADRLPTPQPEAPTRRRRSE